ncbi:MAG: phosphocholine cytidylyltransferase family protein [Firmicutes bacterium]|nr:phosphocholine cytidylyltransferase family protein [Bacillota bacterium]
MKALILAAGQGIRLGSITKKLPKALLEVCNTPLLKNSLDILCECGIYDIGIVVGYLADQIRNKIGNSYKGARITYFENMRYAETNNIVSLFSAEKFCDDNMILLECDLLYNKNIILELMESKAECCIAVSPFDSLTMNGTIIKVKDNGIVDSLILGEWQNKGHDYSKFYKTVNIYYFNKNFINNKYMPLIKWYVENMGEKIYYEKVLGSLIYYHECEVCSLIVNKDKWQEIDNESDLKSAEKKYNEILNS